MADIPGINEDFSKTIQGISSAAISQRIPTNIAVNPSTHAMLVEASVTPSGTQDVNLIQVGGVAFSLGQQLAASSLPVVLTTSQLSTLTPLSTVTVNQGTSPWVVSGTVAFSNTTIAVTNAGTFATQAAQSGTWNINNISGTISLPTGASTLAEQQTQTTALGTLLTTSAFQARINTLGQKSMANSTPVVLASDQSAIPVTVTSTTITGTVAVTQSTSPWIVAGGGTAGTAASGVVTVQGIASMTPVQVSQATASNLNATVVGTGTFATQAAQSGTWNIGTVTAVTAITNALPAGSNVIGHVITDTGSTTAVTGTVATQEVALTAIGSFQKSVTTAGTRVQLDTHTCKTFIVKAKATNTGLIYVGDVTVANSNGFILSAGDTVSYDASNTNLVYIDSSVNGEGVSCSYAN